MKETNHLKRESEKEREETSRRSKNGASGGGGGQERSEGEGGSDVQTVKAMSFVGHQWVHSSDYV